MIKFVVANRVGSGLKTVQAKVSVCPVNHDYWTDMSEEERKQFFRQYDGCKILGVSINQSDATQTETRHSSGGETRVVEKWRQVFHDLDYAKVSYTERNPNIQDLIASLNGAPYTVKQIYTKYL